MEFLNALPGAAGSAFTMLLSFLFVLTVVVFVHELGHFVVGRLCGVDVKTFSIGFGKELFGWTDRHGTRWRIAAIPLGGYVKFAGDADAASAPDFDALEHMSERERRGSFYHKSVLQRTAIVAAGPIANFILAIAIFAVPTYLYGRPYIEPRVESIEAGSAAAAAGFQPGDLVVSINGTPITSFSDMQRIISPRAGEPLAVVVERQGQRVDLIATPQPREIDTAVGKQRIGALGIRGPQNPDAIQHRSYGLIESLQYGVADTWFIVTSTVHSVGKLSSGRESADQLSGPIGIMKVSGKICSGPSAIVPCLNLAAVLSVSIGLINLFPIPLLDGGHLLFFLIEAARGRPLSERVQEYGFRLGLVFVVMLMVFVTGNDLGLWKFLHFQAT